MSEGKADWSDLCIIFLPAYKQLHQEIKALSYRLKKFCLFSFRPESIAFFKACEDEQSTETWATKDNRRGKTSRVKTLTRNRPLCCHSHLNSCNLDLLSCTAHLFHREKSSLRVFHFCKIRVSIMTGNLACLPPNFFLHCCMCGW